MSIAEGRPANAEETGQRPRAARLGLEVHGVVAGRLFLPSHAGSDPFTR
ncbi:MAG: hypothetical protein AAB226_01850 [candidate division NC10 bacterium]